MVKKFLSLLMILGMVSILSASYLSPKDKKYLETPYKDYWFNSVLVVYTNDYVYEIVYPNILSAYEKDEKLYVYFKFFKKDLFLKHNIDYRSVFGEYAAFENYQYEWTIGGTLRV